ncbi:hypothetical protein [Ancylomarina longa]|uniref:Uncharacterized protein n=1 Tax=Ancylomarina longa TaxID=2487017 RepID=A0A434AF23_9BACT|nr:hypothetical protein [Ancylomarina longa]RUT72942.1 hypothetical protein DLK05_15900 [Ancylomarina longa]
MKKEVDYILISELPSEDQEPFQKWLSVRARPVIEEEGTNSMDYCWRLDYERWKSFHKIQGYASECVQCDDTKTSIPAKRDDFIRDGWEHATRQAHENGDDKMLMDMSDAKWNLNESLKDVNDDNIHPEINTGDSVGEEDW